MAVHNNRSAYSNCNMQRYEGWGILGLTWADIDDEYNTIIVERQSLAVKGERAIIVEKMKTCKSNRPVNPDPLAFEVLDEYRLKQQQQANDRGEAWKACSYNGSPLIFTAWDGDILSPNLPYKWFEKFCKRYDLPFRCIHSMRHYLTSYRINRGDSMRDISADLGHSQLSTTLNIYTHEFDRHKARERGRHNRKSEMFGTLDNGNINASDITGKDVI